MTARRDRDDVLHEVVARRAAERPGATAVVHGERRLSYAELDATAGAWAAGLHARGVRPGDLVPVLLPRGADLITAILAVLRLGAAYALLDPAWPDRRLAEVIGRLDASLAVTTPADAHRVAPARAWTPPAEPAAGQALPPAPAVEVTGADPACVFFTSGTTGRPKGVLSPHRATARLVRPGTFADFGPGTVVPLAAALPWDAFSLELWTALLSGGTSVVVDEPYLTGPALREAVRRAGADTVWLTAALFDLTVDEDPGAFTGLRRVMTGGERLSVPHVRRFLRHHPGIDLINGYGPVESTVFATTHRLTEADCDVPGGIPVGRPVPGTGVHLVDGEICVSGDGLALGYLGEPELTEEKFPTLRIDGEDVRVYRTGDLGLLDEDGVLHYRGRADRQVKIRGHRVEPAEVERQIEALLPAVRGCRVVARRDGAGTVRALLAFCVPVVPGDPLTGAAEVLAGALVPYHLPEAVVPVDALPVTANGKLDERALLDLAPAPAPPARTTPPAAGAPAAPDTPLTALVTAVFTAVLTGPAAEPAAGPAAGAADPTAEPATGAGSEAGANASAPDTSAPDAVPCDVPFAELGGSSLDAGRVCARLSAALGRAVPISALYAHPTARELARWLAERDAEENAEESAEGDRDPVRDDGRVPLSPMQTGYLTDHLLAPENRSAHCLLLFRIDGDLDLDALDAAVEAVHARHEVLRSAYLPSPEPVAVPGDHPAPVLEVLDPEPDAEAAVRVLGETLGEPLGLTGGETWRTALVPLTDRGPAPAWVFACVVHHIAFDGWSESVLAADLATAYAAARAGGRPVLPPAPTVAEAARLRAARRAGAATGPALAERVAELTGVPPLVWPAALAAPEPAAAEEVRRSGLVLAVDAADRLDEAARRAGTTRYAVLLALYGQVLAALTGQDDFAVGVPVAQRHDLALESAVGCHIDMACLRLRGEVLGGGPASVAAAGRILGRAFAAQDVPFHELVRAVNPPRTGRPPLFQTLLVLQDNTPPALPLDGLTTTLLRPPYLDLPLEAHTELWPLPDGRLRLTVSRRPAAVPDHTARELLKRLADLVHTLPLPVRQDPRRTEGPA
ncbi:AMP-binding protein [Streptomyces sp. NPDC002262]|uniref:AMP-binding protein n=1 Tax=unclassified Streptomyces TaxID=2593676 RepID=UPI00332C169F